jgi:ribosomal protein S12 methylthiotransferase
MGVFPYSFEPGTPATRLPDHLPEEVKEARRDELMAVQQPMAFAFADSLLGYELDVLIDHALPDGRWQGRAYCDAPDIDGTVILDANGIDGLAEGQIVPVELVSREGYDLIGQATGPDESGKWRGPVDQLLTPLVKVARS